MNFAKFFQPTELLFFLHAHGRDYSHPAPQQPVVKPPKSVSRLCDDISLSNDVETCWYFGRWRKRISSSYTIDVAKNDASVLKTKETVNPE